MQSESLLPKVIMACNNNRNKPVRGLVLNDAAKVEWLLPGGLCAHHGGDALGLGQVELQHGLHNRTTGQHLSCTQQQRQQRQQRQQQQKRQQRQQWLLARRDKISQARKKSSLWSWRTNEDHRRYKGTVQGTQDFIPWVSLLGQNLIINLSLFYPNIWYQSINNFYQSIP